MSRCATCHTLPKECTWGFGPYAGTMLLYLQEIAISRGIRSFHIDTPDRISDGNDICHKPLGEDLTTEANFLPQGPVNVGITSGASTPDKVVEDVIDVVFATKRALTSEVSSR